MSTVYTKNHAIGRAVERAFQDIGECYIVYQHRSGDNDFIVKNNVASIGNDFKKVFSARCVDPSIAVLVESF
jgi:hypothetical protein